MFSSSSGYYPQNKQTLKKEVEKFLRNTPKLDVTPKTVLAPHGNLNDCGDILGKLYSAINIENFNNVVIIGPSPIETGPEIGFVEESFETPLRTVSVDTSFTTQLDMSEIFEKREDLMHLSFVEMQLIFLQTMKKSFEVVPITVSNMISDKKNEKAVKKLKEVLNPQDLIITCSNLVESDESSEKVHKKDSEMITLLREKELKKFRKKSEDYGVDGWRAVLSGITSRNGYENISIIGHKTRTPDNILKSSTTGYTGILFH